MQSANITGSNAYIYSRRRELEALMESEGMPTLWFTFSVADNHWADLMEVIGYDRAEYENMT